MPPRRPKSCRAPPRRAARSVPARIGRGERGPRISRVKSGPRSPAKLGPRSLANLGPRRPAKSGPRNLVKLGPRRPVKRELGKIEPARSGPRRPATSERSPPHRHHRSSPTSGAADERNEPAREVEVCDEPPVEPAVIPPDLKPAEQVKPKRDGPPRTPRRGAVTLEEAMTAAQHAIPSLRACTDVPRVVTIGSWLRTALSGPLVDSPPRIAPSSRERALRFRVVEEAIRRTALGVRAVPSCMGRHLRPAHQPTVHAPETCAAVHSCPPPCAPRPLTHAAHLHQSVCLGGEAAARVASSLERSGGFARWASNPAAEERCRASSLA